MVDANKILSSTQLPTLPSVAVRLLKLSDDPETGIKDVVDVVRSDPAITAKILKATNSPFYGFSSEITSIERAVPLLGRTVVTSLALSFSLVESVQSKNSLAEYYSACWMQSVVQATAADILVDQKKNDLDCGFFLAGLLMDIGRLAMLKTISRDYLPVLTQSEKEKRDLYEVENERLGLNHAEISARLMERWSLPKIILKAVWLHHASRRILEEEKDKPEFPLIAALAVSSSVGDYFCSPNKGTALERLRDLTKKFYAFSGSDLEDFLEKVSDRTEESGDLLSINTEALADPGELMAQANEHLAQLALREHVASTQAQARHRVVEEEKKALESKNVELQQQVLHDQLTKVYNRQFFDDALMREIQRCSRDASPVAVLFIDIDRFKQLNDTFGHQFGDEVLKRVSQSFQAVTRQSDVVARYGGEEFVILAHQPTEKGLEKLGERIRARVESEEIYFETTRVQMTVSIGAAIAIPARKEIDLASRLLASADEAMYDSKNNGRNRIHVRSLLDDWERSLVRSVKQQRFSRWLVNKRYFDIPTLSKVLLQFPQQHIQLGQIAKQQGFLDDEQVELTLRTQQETGRRFGRQAVELNLLTEKELIFLLALQQENPVLLNQALVRQGLLSQDQSDQLLRDYLAEKSCAASSVASLSS